MTRAPSDLAFRVAAQLKVEAPWEVYAEHLERYEVHFDGTHIETVRGPVTTDGYGIRVLRRAGEQMGVGYQASTDPSGPGIAAVLADAEATARHSRFPARAVELPGNAPRASAEVEISDPALSVDPRGSVAAYVDEIFTQFEGRPGVRPSFGSVCATVGETTIANSSGLAASFRHTEMDFELAVKAEGGAEGRPPGEYWVTRSQRRLDPRGLGTEIGTWCERARDVRRAVAPPTGRVAVVLPSYVLSEIVPAVVGFRLSGTARLR